MIIRQLTPQDIPSVISLGGRMHEESQFGALTYAPEKVAKKCARSVSDPDMLALVAEKDGEIVGMFGAYVTPYEFGDERIAQDILVYVAPEHRGGMAFVRMIKAYVFWAKEKSAALVFLAQTTGVNQDLVANLYQRLGFTPVGGQFCLPGVRLNA